VEFANYFKPLPQQALKQLNRIYHSIRAHPGSCSAPLL